MKKYLCAGVLALAFAVSAPLASAAPATQHHPVKHAKAMHHHAKAKHTAHKHHSKAKHKSHVKAKHGPR